MLSKTMNFLLFSMPSFQQAVFLARFFIIDVQVPHGDFCWESFQNEIGRTYFFDYVLRTCLHYASY